MGTDTKIITFDAGKEYTSEHIKSWTFTIPSISKQSFNTVSYNSSKDTATLNLDSITFTIPSIKYALALELHFSNSFEYTITTNTRSFSVYEKLIIGSDVSSVNSDYITLKENYWSKNTTKTIPNAFATELDRVISGSYYYTSIPADNTTVTTVHLQLARNRSSSDDTSTITFNGGDLTVDCFAIY